MLCENNHSSTAPFTSSLFSDSLSSSFSSGLFSLQTKFSKHLVEVFDVEKVRSSLLHNLRGTNWLISYQCLGK